MILDSHVHLIAPENLVEILDKSGVDKAFVIPSIRKGIENGVTYDSLKGVLKRGSQLIEFVQPNNGRVIKICKRYGRLIPLAWINPVTENAKEEAEQCLKSGVKGIKLQPGFHKYNLSDKQVIEIVKLAEHYKAPVFIHTGTDVPPLTAEPLIKKFDINFVLMHMGMYSHYTDAIGLAKEYSNVYLDTADPLPPIAVEIAVEELGAEKILMGSDFPFWGNPKISIEKIRIAVKNKKDREKIMGRNALQLIHKFR